MNAYEIEQIEKDVRANFQLPLSYQGWADVERQERVSRAGRQARRARTPDPEYRVAGNGRAAASRLS